ncbi:DUF1484 family protein [Chromobacterium sp. S0633]|uniref:DUF1484 family protein n=1 Tax=Chromobacterium sp. S0633 TaxID=2957805 RepID=UPI0020A1B23A|nr:DUF1484 family protein [Chromobacterium sp. S0633]MCP1291386.1 DUF1484 family protein [Chromobacterium sp. S0633]
MLTLLRQNLEQLRREPQPEWPQLEHALAQVEKTLEQNLVELSGVNAALATLAGLLSHHEDRALSGPGVQALLEPLQLKLEDIFRQLNELA